MSVVRPMLHLLFSPLTTVGSFSSLIIRVGVGEGVAEFARSRGGVPLLIVVPWILVLWGTKT